MVSSFVGNIRLAVISLTSIAMMQGWLLSLTVVDIVKLSSGCMIRNVRVSLRLQGSMSLDIFWNHEVLNSIESVLEAIYNHLMTGKTKNLEAPLIRPSATFSPREKDSRSVE